MFQTRGARLGFSHPFVVVEVETVRSGSHRDTGGPSEARESGLLFSQNCLSLSLSLSFRSSSSVTGAVRSADSPFMADGGRGRAVGKLARSNRGNSSSLQHFWLRAAAGASGGGAFKAGHSWISFLPSSFPLAFSYLSV